MHGLFADTHGAGDCDPEVPLSPRPAHLLGLSAGELGVQSVQPAQLGQRLPALCRTNRSADVFTEIELSRLTRQCLDRRIDDLDLLNAELAAWQQATNADQRQVGWQFTASDAWIKLRHLYPNI